MKKEFRGVYAVTAQYEYRDAAKSKDVSAVFSLELEQGTYPFHLAYRKAVCDGQGIEADAIEIKVNGFWECQVVADALIEIGQAMKANAPAYARSEDDPRKGD